MFWKKRKNNIEMFTIATDNRRNDFRVRPSEKEPIVIKNDNIEFQAIDISAGGVSIHGRNAEGDTSIISLFLPGKNMISATLEILDIDRRNICHCRFKGIDEKSVDEIHQYVLERQKEDLKKNR